MKLLIAHEKHGRVYFHGELVHKLEDGKDLVYESLLDVMMNLIQYRFNEGYYEDSKFSETALELMDAYYEGKLFRGARLDEESMEAAAELFLENRKDYEYERVEIVETEN